MHFFKTKNKDQRDPGKDKVRYDAYAGAVPAPVLFPLTGRVVIKFLSSKNVARVIQTVGRVNRGSICSAYVFEPHVLGSGQTGILKTATDRCYGHRFAVKTFDKLSATKDKVNLFRNEAQVLLNLDHPHLARLIEVWEDQTAVYFVMEYCNDGDLLVWLSERRLRMPDYMENEKVAKALMTQMTRAVLYLHNNGIVYRDLRPDHWVLDGEWTQAGVSSIPFVKLVDFGLARTYATGDQPMKAVCGSLPYMAPEVLLGNYDSQCDMWSLGVLAFLLVTGSPPFYGSESQIAAAIMSSHGEVKVPGRVVAAVSSECIDFIQKLLQRNPKQRMTAAEAFNHPWLISRLEPSAKNIPSAMLPHKRLFEDLPKALYYVADFKFFRKIVLSMMAFSLTSDRTQEVRDLFLFLDQEGAGIIPLDVFQDFLGELDPTLTLSIRCKITKAVDTFDRGGIHFNDLLAALLGSFIAVDDMVIRATFWKFDRRRLGQINVENMREVLGSLYGDRMLETFLREADRDGDKNIDYEEFNHIVFPPCLWR